MTPRLKNGLLVFMRGAMELCWLYAWAAFSTRQFAQRPFPFLEGAATLGLAFAISRAATGRGWRIVTVLLLQASGLAAMILLTMRGFLYPSYPIADPAWLSGLFRDPRTPLIGLSMVVAILWTLAFWAVGVGLARRGDGYTRVCRRFDAGLSAFLVLYIVQFVAMVKGGSRLPDGGVLYLAFPYFLIGLVSVGIARSRGDGRRRFLPGLQRAGILGTFAVTLLLAGGLLFLCLPLLTLAAAGTYEVLEAVAAPLGPAILRILVAVLRPGQIRSEPGSSSPPGGWNLHAVEGGWFTEVVGRMGGWAIVVLCGLLIVIVCGFLLVTAIRWLFSRTGTETRACRRRHAPTWLAAVIARVRTWVRRMLSGMRGYERAVDCFASLLVWARHSGRGRTATETPDEFAGRLACAFPFLRNEISVIVSAFDDEAYGGSKTDAEILRRSRSALRCLRSPVHWPRRMGCRLLGRDSERDSTL